MSYLRQTRLRQLLCRLQKFSRPAILLPLALLLTACATQAPPPRPTPVPVPVPVPVPREPVVVVQPVPMFTAEQEALRTLASQQDRLYRVAAPLLVNNSELCKGNARSLLGFRAKNKYSYSDEFADAAKKALGLDEQLQITGVLAGSGAARIGIRIGDRLISVDDKAMPQGPRAERQAAAILGPLLNGRTSVPLAVERNGIPVALNVPLTMACAFGIELGNADNVNAYADGMRVMITRGMLQFAASDEELAYVMAREMAHNALKHATRQRMNATVSGIIENLIRMHPDMSTMAGTSGIKVTPPELDAAADKLGLYMVARAGYGIDNVLPFWQRLSSQYPPNVLNAYPAIHPTTTARVSAIQKIIADIKAKQDGKKPLMP